MYRVDYFGEKINYFLLHSISPCLLDQLLYRFAKVYVLQNTTLHSMSLHKKGNKRYVLYIKREDMLQAYCAGEEE